MVDLAVGLGVVFSLLFNEFFGVAAGGIVVPGYIALQLHDPYQLIGTLAVAFLTFLVLRGTSHFMFIYGRRRMVLAILIGFILGYLSRQLVLHNLFEVDIRFQAIGFIIPGLIANWMERQGLFQTIAGVIIAASAVRLLLMIITGGEIIGNV
ncbi:poly-gamma-glutamate biosynthesis protein PgsC [candidate division LCP-89 bacterium B3_LCP]|uniref:Poly-gamma-glutamate biosynthesis protein PgsC n=1 Tax=candidate division LCP-89 bacterium B3_LCP TaxID=2012998 RepID=A0A532V3X4_UNCL8|nr:MAG: poly-gamma-glutamate biosynthesis protein PgsC [candidate division LCP-89 bacterium B3_LCP]